MGCGWGFPMPKTSREELSHARMKKEHKKKFRKMCAMFDAMGEEEWEEIVREQDQATLDVNRDYIERGMVREAIEEEQEDEKAVYRCEWEY